MKVSPCFLFFLFIGISFLACTQEQKNQTKEYLFISHLYQWGVKDNNRIDDRLKGFDFKKYDQLLLGGDLAARTNEAPATLVYLDSIFGLSTPTTHWALGNHDVKHGPLERIEATTGRKTYYVTSFDSLCLVVLNTNEFHSPNYTPKPKECELLDGQLQMLSQLADTIQQASHLIVLHHYTLLTNGITENELDIGKEYNYYIPDLRVDCASEETIESKIYPLFQKIQAKGIQVIVAGGDLGQRRKSFEYQTKDGIWFLGSGINNSAIGHYIPEYVTNLEPDEVLIFERDVVQKTLSWRYELLDVWVKNNTRPLNE